ncbi:MAG: PAS domain S-box protein [Cyclobacteriaceae bacterium]
MKPIYSRTIFNFINEGILIIDPNGKVLEANQSFCKIHGLEKEFPEGFTVWDSAENYKLFDLEDNEIVFEHWPFFKALKGELLKDEIYKAVNSDSQKSFYGLFNTSFIKGKQENIKAIVLSITDITHYVKARKKIEEKEKLLTTIINNSQDGIHVLDLEHGRYDFMSPAQSKLTGFPIEELMLNINNAASRLHPDDIERVNQYLQSVKSNDPPNHPVEYRWKVKSGEYRWFSDNRRAIFDQGKAVKLVGVSRDITDKKRHEEELENLNELLTHMLYMAAHDIKSPIANIKIMLGLLQEAENELQFYLPKLNSSVNHLENVIEGVSKLINAQVNNDIEVNLINLKDEIEKIQMSNQAELESCDAVFNCRIDDDLSFYYVKQYLVSILSNLISNAIKYRDHRRQLQISLCASREDGQIELSVHDNGCGMDLQKYGHQIFKPFKRFNMKVKGTGIGLYLINNLIRKNGGSIEVQSRPGKGTSFICRFNEYMLPPVAIEAPSAVAKNAENQQQKPINYNQRRSLIN